MPNNAPSPADTVTFRFTCELPTEVRLGRVRWRIALAHYPKGQFAVVAVAGTKSGQFVGGRLSAVERAMGLGICVPEGTVRHRLVLALVATGRAVIVSDGRGIPWLPDAEGL